MSAPKELTSFVLCNASGIRVQYVVWPSVVMWCVVILVSEAAAAYHMTQVHTSALSSWPNNGIFSIHCYQCLLLLYIKEENIR